MKMTLGSRCSAFERKPHVNSEHGVSLITAYALSPFLAIACDSSLGPSLFLVESSGRMKINMAGRV